MASIRSSLRSRWTSYRAVTSNRWPVYAEPIACSLIASRCSSAAIGSSYHSVQCRRSQASNASALGILCSILLSYGDTHSFQHAKQRIVQRPLPRASLTVGQQVAVPKRATASASYAIRDRPRPMPAMGTKWRVRLSPGSNCDIQASYHGQDAALHRVAMVSRAIRQSPPMSNPLDPGALPPR